MVGRTLFFRLGNRDEITLNDLKNAFNRIAGLLADLDAAVANDPRGAVRWRVAVLQKQSPPLLGVQAEPIARKDPQTKQLVRRDTSGRVEAALFSGVRSLDAGERPQAVPDAAIEKIERLAVQAKRLGDIHVYSENEQADISEITLVGIRKAIGSATRSKGSILGKLDTIAVHFANEIRVWDENFNRAVRCRYPSELEDRVKELLRQRVLVTGLVAFNARGQAVSVQATDVVPYASPDTLPTIEQVSGLFKKSKDEEISIREYLEHLRDGR